MSRLRRWWRQRWCLHVVGYTETGAPLYVVGKTLKATPVVLRFYWAWIFAERWCPRCGLHYVELYPGWRHA